MGSYEQRLHIFLSHSHEDNDFANKLVKDLRHELGDKATVWYDASGQVYEGDTWWNKIVKELTTCNVFIVILSPEAIKSKHIKNEINLALTRKNSSKRLRIVPVLYQQCEVPKDLATIQYIPFYPPHSYFAALRELLIALAIEDNLAQVKVHRVQLDFSPEALQRLEEIKVMSGAGSRAEAIRNSLRLYEWFVNEVEPDSTIKIINSNNVVVSQFKAKILKT